MTAVRTEAPNEERALQILTADDLIRTLAKAYAAAGEELYLVGGAVRMALLGVADPDIDFATSARPAESKEVLGQLAIGDVFAVGEKFGTIGLRAGERLVEITTYRSHESYPPNSRKPVVEFGHSLSEDVARRDFTINAIAYAPPKPEFIDLLGGIPDLSAHVIRGIGTPVDRFREDPLRLLRAVRLSGRLGFEIEPITWAALQECAPTLERVARERIQEEYTKMLTGERPVRALTMLRDGNLMAHSVPQLLELAKMPDHGPRHALSLWDHVMRVVAEVPPDLTLRWAALLHDIAKPITRKAEPDGRPRFFHHEEIGADMAREVLSGLRYPNQLIDDVSLLIETHMQLHGYSPEWSDGAIRRLLLRLGNLTEKAVLLGRADAAGHALDGTSGNAWKFDELQERIDALGHEKVQALRSPLSGEDLMRRYQRGPGQWIRPIKDALLEEVLEGRLAPEDKESAWRIADRLVNTSQG